jgi:hypothetical protein
MATQLITPNLDPFIWSHDKNGKYYMVTDWLGWCMGYVNSAYSNTQKDGTDKVNVNSANSAWQGWLSSQLKHTDQSFPVGVWVPAWFSYYGTVNGVYGNWGHVVLVHKNADGSLTIKSSPLSHKATADTYTSIAQIESKYKCKYVGWSEDVAGTKVINMGAISTGGDMVTDRAQLDRLYIALLERNRGAGEGEDVYLGKDSGFVFNDIYNSAERVKRLAARAADLASLQTAVKSLTQQVTDLTTKVADLTSKLADTQKAVDIKQGVIDKLTAQLTAANITPVDPSITVTQTGLWAAFKKFLGIK